MPDPQVAWGIDLLLLFATSIALEHGTRRRATDPDGDEEALAQALLQADSGRYPHISDLGEELLSGTPEARFGWHVRVLVAGLASTPLPPRAAPGAGI